jgi:hypothetical protein
MTDEYTLADLLKVLLPGALDHVQDGKEEFAVATVSTPSKKIWP